MMTNNQPIILVVEDSEEDFYTTKRALKKSGLANKINHCKDGQEAIDYLLHKNKYASKEVYPNPNLILLDLNLPKANGKQVLEVIKSNAQLKTIPVVILTTSDDENDIQQCYLNGANSYIQKPVDLDKFMTSIQKLKDYWFEIVLLSKTSE